MLTPTSLLIDGDRFAKRKRARGGGLVLNDKNFQPQHSEHGFECYRPHPFLFSAATHASFEVAVLLGGLAEQFASVPRGQTAEPVNL